MKVVTIRFAVIGLRSPVTSREDGEVGGGGGGGGVLFAAATAVEVAMINFSPPCRLSQRLIRCSRQPRGKLCLRWCGNGESLRFKSFDITADTVKGGGGGGGGSGTYK